MIEYVLALDIGAGGGTKTALFSGGKPAAETLFPAGRYSGNYTDFKKSLFSLIEELLQSTNCTLKGCGISTAGVIDSDGTYRKIINIPFLTGNNLKQDLEAYFRIPTAILNDADAGGLAEWSVLQTELLFWVLGGGWGGTWISETGSVLHSSMGRQGEDNLLHYTNEPGYCVPLLYSELDALFADFGYCFEDFRLQWEKEKGSVPLGPSGGKTSIRAETAVSGLGRYILYRMIMSQDKHKPERVPSEIRRLLSDPGSAGEGISRLSAAGDPAARETDRLFGTLLGAAAVKVFSSMERKVGRLPVLIAGKPSLALPFFGPRAQQYLTEKGYYHYLRPSIFLDRGLNGNLYGAAVAGEQISSAP